MESPIYNRDLEGEASEEVKGTHSEALKNTFVRYGSKMLLLLSVLGTIFFWIPFLIESSVKIIFLAKSKGMIIETILIFIGFSTLAITLTRLEGMPREDRSRLIMKIATSSTFLFILYILAPLR